MAEPGPAERALLAVYQAAERHLMTVAAAQMRALVDGEASSETARREAGLRTVRAATARVVASLDTVAPPLIADAFAEAIARGGSEAVRQVRELTGGADAYTDRGINRGALDRLAVALLDRVREAHSAILRVVPDSYRQAIARVLPGSLVGVETRRDIAQRAMWDLTRRGIVGFTDSAGRRWRLSSYVEMATRSGTARAQLDAQHDRLEFIGHDLVIVKGSSDRCERCRPWNGRILSISGQSGWLVVEHATRDGETVTLDVESLDRARSAGLFHPQCFPGSVLVSAPTGVEAVYSRWYEGELVVIHTASGVQLPVTPNHPVLTPEGWVEAGALRIGDRILRHGVDHEGMDDAVDTRPVPGDQQVPARIGEIGDALRQAGAMATVRMPGAAEQFHGDGCNGDVDVVFADRLLRDRFLAELAQTVGEDALVVAGAVAHPFVVERPSQQPGCGHAGPADGFVGGAGQGLALVLGHGLHAAPVGLAEVSAEPAMGQQPVHGGIVLARVAGDVQPDVALLSAADSLFHPRLVDDGSAAGRLLWAPQDAERAQPLVERRGADADGLGDGRDGLAVPVALDRRVDVDGDPSALARLGHGAQDAGVTESLPDGGGLHADAGRELLRRLAGEVAATEVIHVEHSWWAGHVYNLQTGDGWYVADGLVVSNCRCSTSAYLPGVTKIPPASARKPDGQYEARERQREIERQIRAAKEREIAAISPQGEAKARAQVAAAEARMREHLDANPDLLRRRYREQLGAGNLPPQLARTVGL